MTISPISYSNYNVANLKNNKLKNSPQKLGSSSVSFKGIEKVATSKAATETVKKNGGKILAGLAALLGFVGISSKKKDNNVTENIQVNKPVEKPQSIVESLDVSPEAKIFGKNLENLTRKEYIDVNYYDSIIRDVNVYNKTAIIKAVELYDKDPKTALELASLFKNSGKASNTDVEFVINKYLTEPELVMEYKNKLETHARNSYAYGNEFQRRNWKAKFDDILHLTKALDKNKEIVDMVIEKLDNQDLFRCRSINALTNFDKTVVNKYLNETRVPFDYDDITKLCELDNKYSKEIDELMDVANSMMTKEDRRRYPNYNKYKISNVVEKYAESPNEYKELFKLTGINSEVLTDFKDAYQEAPEFITRLCNDFYKKEYCLEYVQDDALRDIPHNYKEYESILNLLDKQGWQNMSSEDFAKNMKSIKQTKSKIDSVIKEAGGDISKCATRIVNIVKANQLPFEKLYGV